MKVQRYTDEIAREWDAFIAASKQGWVMHLRGFLDAVNNAWQQLDCSFVLRDNSKIICAVPLQYRDHDGSLRSAGRAWAGPAFADGVNQAALWPLILREVRRAGSKCSARFWHFAGNSLAPDVELTGAEAAVDSHTIQVINLDSGANDVLAGISKDARRLVRKAREEGVSVRRLSDPAEILKIYYPIHQETYSRTGQPAHPIKYFEGIFNSLVTDDICRVFAADYGGQTIALVNIAVWKGAAWYWTGCSTRDGLAKNANYLLQAEVLEYLCQENIGIYETGEIFESGSGGKLDGLSRFKKKFGGESSIFNEYVINLQPIRSKLRSILAGDLK